MPHFVWSPIASANDPVVRPSVRPVVAFPQSPLPATQRTNWLLNYSYRIDQLFSKLAAVKCAVVKSNKMQSSPALVVKAWTLVSRRVIHCRPEEIAALPHRTCWLLSENQRCSLSPTQWVFYDTGLDSGSSSEHIRLRPHRINAACCHTCCPFRVCVRHTGEFCRNGWTDRDAVWDADSNYIIYYLGVRVYWHQLANTIEPFVRGGDAALCQITLSTERQGRRENKGSEKKKKGRNR